MLQSRLSRVRSIFTIALRTPRDQTAEMLRVTVVRYRLNIVACSESLWYLGRYVLALGEEAVTDFFE